MIDYKIGHVKTRVTLKQFKDGCMNVNINCLSVMPSNLHQVIVVHNMPHTTSDIIG